MTNMHAQRSSSFSQRVLKQAFSQLGAKIGLVWVLLLVVLAVFSPLIANTIPLIALQKEEWVFPFMRYITVEDAFVFSSFLAILLLLFTPLRRSFSRFMMVLLAFLLVLALVINAWVKPPQLVIYDDFRAKEYLSQFDWVVHAPIPYSPRDYMRDVSTLPLEKPLADATHTHWFGTEENGADVLSRMVHASRIALGIGFIATGIAMLIGTILGGLMGYFSGFIDMIGMRLVEVFESIPTLFLLLTFVAFFGPSIYFLMVIIGITSWSGYARYVRAEFLKLRKQEYVQAAIASGLSLQSILFRHMLPNGVAPLLVAASFGMASAILAEATLSFLGLGLVDSPSWGQMLNQAVKSSTFNWWMAIFPGMAIFMTVFAYNLIGEALRDAIDPQMERQGGGR